MRLAFAFQERLEPRHAGSVAADERNPESQTAAPIRPHLDPRPRDAPDGVDGVAAREGELYEQAMSVQEGLRADEPQPAARHVGARFVRGTKKDATRRPVDLGVDGRDPSSARKRAARIAPPLIRFVLGHALALHAFAIGPGGRQLERKRRSVASTQDARSLRRNDPAWGCVEEGPLVPFPVETEEPRALHVPADTFLALWSDLRSFGLAEGLEWIQAGRRSGLLRLTAGTDHREIYLARGEVVFASSNQPIDRLGASLLRSGILKPEQLHAANRVARAHQRFGKTLVQLGYLTPQALWRALRAQVEEIVCACFLIERGELAFWEGDIAPDNMIRLELDMPQLIEAAAHWRAELEQWIEAIGHSGVQIEAVPDKRRGFGGLDAQILDALGTPSRFAALGRRIGVDAVTAARSVLLLHRAGAVRIERVDEDPESTQRVRDEDARKRLQGWLGEAGRCIDAFLGALERAGPGGSARDRFATAIEEVAARFPGVLAHADIPSVGSFPFDAVLQRSQELPAEACGDVVCRARRT